MGLLKPPIVVMFLLLKKSNIFFRATTCAILFGVGILWGQKCDASAPECSAVVIDSAQAELPLFLRNINRAIALTNQALVCYFSGERTDLKMSRYYNISTGSRSDELASVWMFGSSFQAVTAVLESLVLLKEKGYNKIYDQYFDHYKAVLKNLYKSADYYLGRFQLTSYTQTKKWEVYGVNRGNEKGAAAVKGRENVYDDQMWLIRDFLDAFKVTADRTYLDKAEYLAAYVLDGWDPSIDESGKEVGGITWGPGYVTKHACSNAPLIGSLVRLSKLYGNSDDKIAYRYIDRKDRKTRRTRRMTKKAYYLMYAKKLYDWQKKKLLDPTVGVYADMLGAQDGKVRYHKVDGERYRQNTPLGGKVGSFISYNSGTMLSGAADLYKLTGEPQYLKDAKALSAASFRYFAKKGKEKPEYYSYKSSGFNGWFNGVLFRGFVDAWFVDKSNAGPIESFQKNLDFAYSHYLKKGLLPQNLLMGWGDEKDIGGMIMFTYAGVYATLAQLALKGVFSEAGAQ